MKTQIKSGPNPYKRGSLVIFDPLDMRNGHGVIGFVILMEFFDKNSGMKFNKQYMKNTIIESTSVWTVQKDQKILLID